MYFPSSTTSRNFAVSSSVSELLFEVRGVSTRPKKHLRPVAATALALAIPGLTGFGREERIVDIVRFSLPSLSMDGGWRMDTRFVCGINKGKKKKREAAGPLAKKWPIH